MLRLFKKISDLEFVQCWNYFHVSIVGGYISNLSTTCDFPELPSAELLVADEPWQWDPQIVASFKQELKEMFVVPTLNIFHSTQNRITNVHLVESFLSLLLQLLYHKTDEVVDRFEDGIENLEKELRFLLTILGDISWMLCHTNDLQAADFQNLLPQFEEVVNQAGSFVHYLFFSEDRAFEKTDDGLAAFLNQIDLLKANLQSSISASAAYNTTPRVSVVDSILILDSVVEDLDDLLKREDDPIADVKDKVNLLHHQLLISHSSIKDMGSPKPSEIEELKEALMCIGGIAHQAEYLVTSFLVKDAPLWYVLKRLTHLTHRIEPIKMELLLTIEKCQFEGLQVEESLQDKRNAEVNDIFVGFEDKTTEILYQLVGGGTQSLEFITISGMPGLGKTTLANKLYNHPLVSDRFDKLSWSVVSQTYNILNILVNILSHISGDVGKNSISKMRELIHKTLIGRRYLVVLDDIWDSNVLDELLSCFPDSRNGSKVLLTSRNKDVAPPNSILHELPFFTDEQCWELLEKKTFGSRSCPPQLQGIGKKIAAKCCGLPLTVVVIAGVLSTIDEEESRWEEVGGSLASYTENSVMQILELSYKHLPDHLKPCFLYFGEKNKEATIFVGDLKRLWVAEGFIRKEKDKSAENIAGEYLMELIDRSLVIIAKRSTDGRGVKTCVVHDLLCDLCLKLSKEERFLKCLNNHYHTIYERDHRIRVYEESATLSYCQHIRSFFSDIQSSSLYVRDMRLLRVLYFNNIYGFETLTFGIEYLVNLRFLVIDNLPTWIDRLVNLEYVRMDEVETYLPPSIVKMKKLRYLRASYAEYGEDWNTCQTCNLEYLSGVSIKKLKDEELLKCSPHLRKLKCIYEPEGLERACSHFDLCFLTQLLSLSLDGFLSKGDFVFPSNIRKLTLCGSGLPWEKISIVGILEYLEVLKLYENAFVGETWDTKDGEFQKLRFLELENIQLSEWIVASNEHFPQLQQLILTYCWHLQEIPSEIGDITTLELIEVKRRCQKSMVDSAERIKEEQRDMGNEDLRVNISTAEVWEDYNNDFNSPHPTDESDP